MTEIERVFDWKPSTHVEQNKLFGIANLDCYSAGSHRTKIKRYQPLNLNQFQEGACSGFGAAHALASTPSGQLDLTNAIARQIYLQAQREDEWPGEAYDGSSVNGAMHACRTFGRIKAWRWAKTINEVLHGLSYHGSAEVGSDWYEGMLKPDAKGYLRRTGAIVGGHAYCISGYRPAIDRAAPAVDFWVDNSWGSGWGISGGAWLTDVAAKDLWFKSYGEVAFPIK